MELPIIMQIPFYLDLPIINLAGPHCWFSHFHSSCCFMCHVCALKQWRANRLNWISWEMLEETKSDSSNPTSYFGSWVVDYSMTSLALSSYLVDFCRLEEKIMAFISFSELCMTCYPKRLSWSYPMAITSEDRHSTLKRLQLDDYKQVNDLKWLENHNPELEEKAFYQTVKKCRMRICKRSY